VTAGNFVKYFKRAYKFKNLRVYLKQCSCLVNERFATEERRTERFLSDQKPVLSEVEVSTITNLQSIKFLFLVINLIFDFNFIFNQYLYHMNIAVLTRGEHLYSTQSLIRAGEARNHSMEVIDPTFCNIMIENGKPILQYHDEIVDDVSAIIPRIGASNTYYGTSLVRQFEAMGVATIAESSAILNSRDKWTSFQILAQAGIPVPKTTLGGHYYLDAFLKNFGQGPVIIKILEGTHGQGVILCESYKNALATVETLQTANVKFVMQEYIAESKGADIRALVVNGAVVASMKRQAAKEDFRSNLHSGGKAENIILSNAEISLAINAAKALNLTVCGVDILQSKRGPLVLEINSTPGLEGIETTTGINISTEIIKCIETLTN
jgi:ribosomal protein S6--L-glutamate ligase